MEGFVGHLKQRKLVQWAVAYVAFAFALIQVGDVVADSYGWSHGVMHLLFGLLVLGFIVVLLLAWYHGEQGRQMTIEMMWSPMVDPIRDDPRFKAVLKKMGLPYGPKGAATQ